MQGWLVAEAIRFEDAVTPRPPVSGIDVRCNPSHFSIVAYAVPVSRLQGRVPSRFRLQTILLEGKEMALISVVSFLNTGFTSAVYPGPRFSMGQSDYRIYVYDTRTSTRCVWFLGSTLDSWTRIVPRYLWRMPWHKGQVSFDCKVNETSGYYDVYKMTCSSDWCDAHLELRHSDGDQFELPGFPDVETGLVHLTHPLTGYYYRVDGKVAHYSVWHQRLEVKPAVLLSAKFSRLDELGIVSLAEQQSPYAVMVQPSSAFFVYLPPRVAG